MKIAVSATGKDMDSIVDQRFGRAEYLLIVETDSNSLVEVIDNQAAKAAEHGAGIGAASRIAQSGAKAILTGHVGPKAAAVCEKAGIAMVNSATGTVREAVNAYIQKKNDPGLTAAACPTDVISQDGAGRGMGQGMGRGMGQGRGLGGGRRRGQCGSQGQGRRA